MLDEVASRDDNRVPVELGVSRKGKIRQRKFSDAGGAFSRVEPNEFYKAYNVEVPLNTHWDTPIHIDVGTAFAAKYGVTDRIAAVSGYIICDSNIQLSLNGIPPSQDEILMGTSPLGKEFELRAGDLGILDIYFANYALSGGSPTAKVFIFVSG